MGKLDENKCTAISIYVSSFSFERSERLVSVNLSVGIHAKVSKTDVGSYRIETITQISNTDDLESAEGKLNIKMVLVGLFKVEDFDDTSKEGKRAVEQELLRKLLPQIKQQITSFTIQPGMNPIVLPEIDAESFISDK